jgi:O-antigen ligase
LTKRYGGRIDGLIAVVAGAAVVALFAGPVPLAVVAAVLIVAAGAIWPVVTLGLVVATIPFQPITRSVGHYDFSATEVLIVLATAAAVLRLVAWAASATSVRSAGGSPGVVGAQRSIFRDWYHRAGDPVTLLLVGLFVLAGVVSLSASVTVHQSIQSLRVVIVEPAVFYLLAVTQIRTRRELCLLALALVVGGVLISLFGLWQYAVGDRIITAEAGLRRIRGFYGSPNNLGLYLGRTVPFALALALWWPRGRRLLVVATIIMALALLLTFSLGAFVAVGMSALLVTYLWSRRAFFVGVLASGVVLAVGAVAALSIPRLGSHFDLQSSTTSIRLDVWQSAIRMLAGHSLRGIGLDNFLYYYQNGYRLPSAWQEPNLSHPHNFILDFWLSLGLPGLLVLVLLVGRFVELVHRSWRDADSVERGLYAGAIGALADTFLHGAVDNSFFLPDLAVLFWLMFAIVAVPLASRARSVSH